jgi:flagellar FliL protein
MADVAADAAAAPAPASRRKPLLIGAALALVLGGAGFGAAYTGVLSGLVAGLAGGQDDSGLLPGDAVFVPLAPMVVSLGPLGNVRNLRVSATLEVPLAHQAEVTRLMPRLLDVLNGYLRAVEPAEFAEPGALIRVRAQMLRRLQIVAGEGRVRDLLLTEFVLN